MKTLISNLSLYIIVIFFSLSYMQCAQAQDQKGNQSNNTPSETTSEKEAISENTTANSKSNIPFTEKDLVLNLEHGFVMVYGEADQMPNGEVLLKGVAIYKDDKPVFESKEEFEIKKEYQSLRPIEGGYELLLYVNQRPDKDNLLLLKFSEDKLLTQEYIPEFDIQEEALSKYGKFKFAGMMHYYQPIGENGELMPYIPIMVYDYDAKKGISFDKESTERSNARAYGKYMGKNYSEDFGLFENENVMLELEGYNPYK